MAEPITMQGWEDSLPHLREGHVLQAYRYHGGVSYTIECTECHEVVLEIPMDYDYLIPAGGKHEQAE